VNQTQRTAAKYGVLAILLGTTFWVWKQSSAEKQQSIDPDSPAPSTNHHSSARRQLDPESVQVNKLTSTATREVVTPESIALKLRSGNQADKDLALTKLLPQLIEQEPAKAAKFIESLEPWAWRIEAMHLLARAWAKQNVEAAATWAARLKSKDEKLTALSDIVIQANQSDPKEALVLCEKYDFATYNPSTVHSTLQALAKQDSQAAIEWVQQQPDLDFRNEAYSQIAMATASQDPSAAAQLVTSVMTPGSTQEEAAMSILHQWILKDPKGAKAWVAVFPNGDFRQRAEDELTHAEAYQVAQPHSH
jgi:hypothetical protein